jgi:hypothetical protein
MIGESIQTGDFPNTLDILVRLSQKQSSAAEVLTLRPKGFETSHPINRAREAKKRVYPGPTTISLLWTKK